MFTLVPGTGTAGFLQRIFWSDSKTHLLNFNLKNILNEVKFGGNNPLKRQWVANFFICEYKTVQSFIFRLFLKQAAAGSLLEGEVQPQVKKNY